MGRTRIAVVRLGHATWPSARKNRCRWTIGQSASGFPSRAACLSSGRGVPAEACKCLCRGFFEASLASSSRGECRSDLQAIRFFGWARTAFRICKPAGPRVSMRGPFRNRSGSRITSRHRRGSNASWAERLSQYRRMFASKRSPREFNAKTLNAWAKSQDATPRRNSNVNHAGRKRQQQIGGASGNGSSPRGWPCCQRPERPSPPGWVVRVPARTAPFINSSSFVPFPSTR